MAEITGKRVGEVLRGVFKILVDHPEGLAGRVVLEQLARIVPPTPFEQESFAKTPDQRRYETLARFYTIGVVKAGWMTKNKGLWSLTDDGRAAFKAYVDPERFASEVRSRYMQWKKSRPEVETPELEDEFEGEASQAAATFEQAEESAWTEIEEHLNRMNPYDFQNLVAGLLRGMGYYIAWVAPPGPDRGVDILAQSDPLGAKGPRIKVQVKRVAERVPSREVRSFLAVVADNDIGLFVATAGFTKDAEEETRAQEKRRIMLIDSRRLVDLWVEHYEKIPEEHRQLMTLRPVYFLAPEVT